MSHGQENYEKYHSPEQRNIRLLAARQLTETAVSEAQQLFFSGDEDAALDRLFNAGLQAEGVSYYFDLWSSD